MRAGYLRAERVKQLVDEHLSRRYDHGNRIWLLLSAEVWYRRYISRRSQADLEIELADRLSEPAMPAPGPERIMSSECVRTAVSRPDPGDRRDLAAAVVLRLGGDRETITLGDAIQRFRDVNGYVGLPVPAKPHFLKLFRKLINGSRAPEKIYLVHDASHVLTGTTFTHNEPQLVLLAGEAAEQGLYLAREACRRLWVGCCSMAGPSSSAPGGSPLFAR